MSVDRLVVCIEHKRGVRSILFVKATKDQDATRVDLISHSQIARHPVRFVLHVDDVPDVSLNIVGLANISDLFRTKLDSAREDIDELSVEDTASGRVSGDIQVCHADPFVSTDIVILAGFVKVLGIVTSNDIDPVLFALIDGSEITAGIVQVSPVLEHAVFFNVFQHPVAADVLLHAARDTVQSTVVADDCPTELGNVVFKVDEVLALFVRDDVVEVNVLVSPFKVMDDPLVGQLLLDDEDVLEEVDDALIDIKMVELSNHRLLVLQVAFVGVYKRISLINDTSNVVKAGDVGCPFQLCQCVLKRLIFPLFSFQLKVHVLNRDVVTFELPEDHLFVRSFGKLALDLFKVTNNLRELVLVGLLTLCFLNKFLRLVS